MKFTKEFKEFLVGAYKEYEADAVEVVLQEDEEGNVDINIGLVDTKDCDRVVEIDGVKVAVDEASQAALIDAIFSFNNGEVLIDFEEKEEDCCCGGHHHHHAEGCCCEGEEDGCCGGHHTEGCCCEGDGDDCCCDDHHHKDHHCCCHEE